MQDEMKTECKKTLTNEELDRLEQLGKDIETYQKLYSDASIERLNLETEKQSLEQEIRTILYPRRDQLKSRSADDDDSQLEERRKELESLKKALVDILARQKSTENDVEKIAKSMRENHAKLTELQVNTPLEAYAYCRRHMQRLLARLNGIRRM
jgi:predicted outer membrane protein